MLTSQLHINLGLPCIGSKNLHLPTSGSGPTLVGCGPFAEYDEKRTLWKNVHLCSKHLAYISEEPQVQNACLWLPLPEEKNKLVWPRDTPLMEGTIC